MDAFEVISADVSNESPLWAAALLPACERQPVAVFSPLAPERFALGLETVYEAYLVHYGTSRLFDSPPDHERVLLGDYLYAHGLVRIASAGGVDAVAVMADLISTCAALRARGARGDGEVWVDAARRLGGDPGDAEIVRALARHYVRVGS
ncbi:MAG TPA: hypothetical protein VFB25_03950 [Gaiellaceae bacterium]|nr:hypothetical protein [Gaiellaceae bacterium]